MYKGLIYKNLHVHSKTTIMSNQLKYEIFDCKQLKNYVCQNCLVSLMAILKYLKISIVLL